MTSRMLTLLLAGVLAVGLLATAAVAARPGAPKKKIDPQDQALARSMLLKRSDLAGTGWKAEPPDPNDDSALSCPGFEPDLSDLTETGDVDSPTFEHSSGVFASSTASVFETGPQARSAYTRVVKPQLARCLRHLFEEGLKESSGQAPKITVLSSGRLPFPRLADRTDAYRLVAGFTVGGQKFKVYVDFVLLHHGRAVAAVFVGKVGQPLAPAAERGLAALVAQRMAKA